MPESKQHAPRGRIKAHPMSQTHPMSLARRCSAQSKQKQQQCGHWAIPGGSVCRYHGGLAPQVKGAAEKRLLALQDPAIVRLGELVAQTEYPSVAIAAVKDVLDRTFGRPTERVDMHVSGDDALLARLATGRNRSEKPAK